MKMTTITILMLSLFLSVLTAPPNQSIYIAMPESVRPYEAIWNATCKVESGFDVMAIGDKHLKEHSYGIAQIRKSRLDDFNARTGHNYTLMDMYCPKKSKSVYMYYAAEIGPYNFERICREWNGGPDGMNKKSTVNYYNLIKTKL